MERRGDEGMSEPPSARGGASVTYGFKSPYTTIYNSPSVPSLQGKQLGGGMFSPLAPGSIEPAVQAATSMSVIGKNAQFTLDVTRDINNTIVGATDSIATLAGASLDDTPSSDLHPLQVAEQMLVQYQKDVVTNPQLALIAQQQAQMQQDQPGSVVPGMGSIVGLAGTTGMMGLTPTIGTGDASGIGNAGMMGTGAMNQPLMGINNGVVGSTLSQIPGLVGQSIQQGFEPNHLCAFRAVFFNVEGSDSAISVATEEDEEVNKVREQLIMQQRSQLQQQQQQLLLLQQQQQQQQMGLGGGLMGGGGGLGLGGFGTTGNTMFGGTTGLGMGGGFGTGFGGTTGTGLGMGMGMGTGMGVGLGAGMQMGQPLGLNINIGANNPSLVEQIKLANQLYQLNATREANNMPGVGEVPFPFDEASWLAALSSLKKYATARSSDPNYVPLVPVMLRGTDEVKGRASKLLALTNLVKNYTDFVNSSLQTTDEDEDDCEMLRQSVQGMRRRLLSLVGKLSAGSGCLYAAGGAAGKWADLNKQLTVKLHNIGDTMTELKMQADDSVREARRESSRSKSIVLSEGEKHDVFEKLQNQSHALLKLAKEVSQTVSK